MKKLTFLQFLNKNKVLFIGSLLLIIPLALIFELSSIAMVNLYKTSSIFNKDNFILTYLYPIYLGLLVIFTITYTYAIKNQVLSMTRYLRLIEYSGEDKKVITKILIMFYGAIYMISLVVGFFLGVFDLFYLVIPTILLLISIISSMVYLRDIK